MVVMVMVIRNVHIMMDLVSWIDIYRRLGEYLAYIQCTLYHISPVHRTTLESTSHRHFVVSHCRLFVILFSYQKTINYKS